MNIKINGKNYQLRFGLRFLEVVDKEYGVEASVDGMTINTRAGGMDMLLQGLENYSPPHLGTVIRAGTAHLREKPTDIEVEDYVIELINGDEEGGASQRYFDFYDEVNDEMGKNSALQIAIKGKEALAKKKEKKA